MGWASWAAMDAQVKRHCGGCGSGGDWAVRVEAARASDHPVQQAAADGTPPTPDRISLLFYLVDEQVGRLEGP